MKKHLSFLLLVAMLLTVVAIVPATAATYAADTIAVIGTKEYNDLQTAFDEAINDSVIEIVKDANIAGALTFANDDINANLFVKNVTVKGNNHTLTFSDVNASSYAIKVSSICTTIENLTIKSPAGGITVNDSSRVTLNNCTVLACDTAKDTVLAADATNAKLFAINLNATTRGYVEINGGHYESYGKSVVIITKGDAVINGGTFIGENCEFVVRANNSAAGDPQTTNVWINGGTFVKPLTGKVTSEGGVVRADRGAAMYIYGGTFANFQDGTGNARDYVILAGESGNTGELYIFGGDFYLLNQSKNAQLIGNYGSADTVGARVLARIYGGTFYAIAMEGRTEKNIINCSTNGIQKLPAAAYTQTTTENVKGTYDNKEYTFITKSTFAYNYSATKADPDAAVMITNADNSVYYAESLEMALKLAKDGATLKLLKDVELTSTLETETRNVTLTIDGNGKTMKAKDGADVTYYAFLTKSGKITVKNLKVNMPNAAAFGLGYYAEEGDTRNTYLCELELIDCDLTVSADIGAVECMTILAGSLKLTNTKVNGTAVNETKTFTIRDAEIALQKMLGIYVEDETTTPEEETTTAEPETTVPANDETTAAATTEESTTKAPDKADDGNAKGGCGAVLGSTAWVSLGLIALCGAVVAKKAKK